MKTIIRTNGLKEHRNDKTELKTIKELKTKQKETESRIELYGLQCMVAQAEDVLGKIDEMSDGYSGYIDAEELKARITG